jgi:hypothetical protein
MGNQSESSHLHVLFGAALKRYTEQTNINLAEDHLAKRLKDCKTVESITAILSERAQDFKKFREKDKVLKPLKKVLTILHRLSSLAVFGQGVGWVSP